jgi:putative membrane protein
MIGKPVARRNPSQPWTASEYFMFGVFVFWSIAGLVFTFARITPASVGAWRLPLNLQNFVDLCIYCGDPILIILAFANTHLHASRQWTGGVARRWAFTIVLCAFVIETVGTITSLPFGDYHYTDRFGPSLSWLPIVGPTFGTVPLTIPLAWHVILTNALFLVRAVQPHASAIFEALAAAFLCMVYDFVLEPFATTVKGYWVWAEGSVPLLNYIAWFILSALLIRRFAPTIASRFRFDPRPISILVFTILIFLAGEFATRFYR